jgi:hypothetical protein
MDIAALVLALTAQKTPQGFSKVVQLSVMVEVGHLMSELKLATFEKP